MKKRSITLATAGAVAAAGLAVAAGSAQASQWPPACQYHAHACVAVDNQTGGNVHSLRVNGQCLLFNNPGTSHYYSRAAVEYGGTPTTLTYSGYHCEGNTQNSETVRWDTNTGSGNYRWAHITYYYHPRGPIT